MKLGISLGLVHKIYVVVFRNLNVNIIHIQMAWPLLMDLNNSGNECPLHISWVKVLRNKRWILYSYRKQVSCFLVNRVCSGPEWIHPWHFKQCHTCTFSSLPSQMFLFSSTTCLGLFSGRVCAVSTRGDESAQSDKSKSSLSEHSHTPRKK